MKTIYFLVLGFLSLTAEGQNGDYLVKQNGDTLYGAIALINKEFVVTGPAAGPFVLSAEGVKKVHAGNFKGEIVLPCLLHIYADDLELLLRYQYISGDRDTVLLLNEVYSTPKMNLYWCKDEAKMQYYFYKTPTDPRPVQLYVNYALGGGSQASFDKIDVRGEESVTHIEVMKGYINQLREIMNNCKNISETTWQLLDYRIYSLKNLIKKYNNCR